MIFSNMAEILTCLAASLSPDGPFKQKCCPSSPTDDIKSDIDFVACKLLIYVKAPEKPRVSINIWFKEIYFKTWRFGNENIEKQHFYCFWDVRRIKNFRFYQVFKKIQA